MRYRAILILMPMLLLLIAGRTPLAATDTSTSTTGNSLPAVQEIMAQQGIRMPWSGPMPTNLTVGCYEISSNESSWQSISCAPANETAVIDGIQGGNYYGLDGEIQTAGLGTITYSEGDTYVSSCTVYDQSGSCEETTNDSYDGNTNNFGDWSFQLNTNTFSTTGGYGAWDQFSYINYPDHSWLYSPYGPVYQLCIEQWYNNGMYWQAPHVDCVNTAANEFYPGVVVTIHADASAGDLSSYVCLSYPGGGNPYCWATVKPDYYGLAGSWSQSYSGILGPSDNARASFASGTSLVEDTEILGPASYNGGSSTQYMTGETNDLSYSNEYNGHETTNGNEEWYLNFDSSN